MSAISQKVGSSPASPGRMKFRGIDPERVPSIALTVVEHEPIAGMERVFEGGERAPGGLAHSS
jgi:hypothetical protein